MSTYQHYSTTQKHNQARFRGPLSYVLAKSSAVRRLLDPLGNDHISGRGAFGIASPGGLSLHKRSSVNTIRGNIAAAPRGVICGFSKQSRRRMQRRLALIDFSAIPCYFGTITYHEDIPATNEERKAQLKALWKRINRRYGNALVGAIWKEELKPRLTGEHKGEIVPHWHLIMFFHKHIDQFELQFHLAPMWAEITGHPEDAGHLAHGIHIEKPRNTRGKDVAKLMAYLSKYMSKEVETDEQTGRMWGQWGEVPIVYTAWCISLDDYTILCRRVRKWGKRSLYCSRITALWRGFLIYGDGYQLLELTRGLESFMVI